MGVEHNECVIATTWDDNAMRKVTDWVKTLNSEEQSLFSVTVGIADNKKTLFMAPDGSKKGWDVAERCTVIRNELIALLKTFNHSDKSNPFDYVEVGYGELGQRILRGNCRKRY